MKPTRLHYFYAHNWPARIWFGLFTFGPVLLMAGALGTPPPDLLGLGADAKRYLFLLGITWLLGFFGGGLLGWFILGPLYHYRAELNGYPFQTGERVQILVGAKRGRVARITEVREVRGEVCVELPESGGHNYAFAFTEVIRVPG
jgi:hypothetical protein